MKKVLWLKTSTTEMAQFEELAATGYNLQLVKFSSASEAQTELNTHSEEYVAILFEDGTLNRKSYFFHYGLELFLLSANTNREPGTTYTTFVCGEDDENLLKAISNIVAEGEQSAACYPKLSKAMNTLNVPKTMQKKFLRSLEKLDGDDDPGEIFTMFRILVEYIFRGLAGHSIIPQKLVNSNHGNLNMTDCCKYLAGEDADIVGVRYGKKGDYIVNKSTMKMLESVIDMGNSFSHSSTVGHFETEDTLESKQLCAHMLVWLFYWFEELVKKSRYKDFLDNCVTIDTKNNKNNRSYYNRGFDQACNDYHNDILKQEYLKGYEQGLADKCFQESEPYDNPYSDYGIDGYD